MIKGTKPPDESAGSITLNNHGIEAISAKNLPKSCTERGCEIRELLARPHDVKIKVRSDAKIIEDLSRHFSVLGSRDREGLEGL